jgi:hypothetical protein
VRLTIRRDGREIDAWLTAERSCRYAGLEVSTRGSGTSFNRLDSDARFAPIYTTGVRAGDSYVLSNDTTWAGYRLTEGDSVWRVYGDTVAVLRSGVSGVVDGSTVGTLWSPTGRKLDFTGAGIAVGENVITPYGLATAAARPSVEFGVAISCGECGWRRSLEGIRFETSEFPVIDAVEAGGPAAEAGLLVGDILIAIDGHPIPSAEGGRRLGALEAGERVALEVRRADRIIQVSIAPRAASGQRLRM